ncbi:hypothetical protein FPV67DRAFT_1684135 [Lyophyllum atratum]|nr:hypothetical protein FPV67DRAFT_1684135 [Lyophyllum atratum]
MHQISLDAEAQTTSLYIPGFEPQPVSADILGVGQDGRTTWVLHQGEATAHASDQSGSFFGTATLVEGPSDASLTYANSAGHFTIGQVCSFFQGYAICTLVAGGSTAVQTELTSHVPVQVASAQITSPLPGTTTLPSSQQSTTTSVSATVPGVPSQTQSAGPPIIPNTARAAVPRSGGLLVSAFLASLTTLMWP